MRAKANLLTLLVVVFGFPAIKLAKELSDAERRDKTKKP